jgi:predicted Fe-S protein YdhL (DUF1289 family)
VTLDPSTDPTAGTAARPDDDREARAARRAEPRRRAQERVFDTSVPSPCISVCQLDTASNLCIGCLRHVDEIRDWPILTAEEKTAVLERIEARKSED